MAAPELTFTASGQTISGVSGYDSIQVAFQSDSQYQQFECRATKVSEAWGLGKGRLIASFSLTPANVTRSFDIYDEYLTNGDGEYRISLYAQGMDGSWNDNHGFIPRGKDGLTTADGRVFLCIKEA